MNKVWLLLGVVLLLLGGCAGGGGALKAESPASAGGPEVEGSASPLEAPQPQDAPQEVATLAQPASPSLAPPPPPSVRAESGSSSRLNGPEATPTPAPARKERPGLGTQWGEQRESHIHDVDFVRADDNRPFAVASVFYNDRAGVQALAAFHEPSTRHVREASAAGGSITMSIRDNSGEPLEAVRTSDRTYVIGEEGQRYSIVLVNHTGRRFEAVATVDGLDVINGETGTFTNRGYILMPFSTLEIDGFRQTRDVVAAFRFSKVGGSYAARTGKPRNVGVIGVAFFSELGDEPVWTPGELERRDTANPFPSDARFAKPPR